MWLWLWIGAIALEGSSGFLSPFGAAWAKDHSPAPASSAPQPSSERTSPSEAESIWKQAREHHQGGRFKEAIPLLQRVIERFPASPGFTEAHLLLGIALLELGESEKAIAPLKYYVEAKDRSLDGRRARIHLGKAYLASGKFNEAYLISIEAASFSGPASPALAAQALLLRTEALIGMNQDMKAEGSLRSALKRIDKLPSEPQFSSLQGQAHWLKLKLKARKCARLPSPGKLDEGQVREQFERRGLCLLEATLDLKKTLKAADPGWAERATRELSDAFTAYSSACSTPPAPKSKRTSVELSRYRAELAHILKKDCSSKYSEALDLLSRFKEQLPSTMHPRLEKVAQTLIQLKDS